MGIVGNPAHVSQMESAGIMPISVLAVNLYAFEDATTVLDDPTSTRWKTFGQVPVDTDVPPGTLGWALRSPALALSGGERTITLTFTCTGELAGCIF